MSTRYALYFAPAQASPWWIFGAAWLGRDECDGTTLTQPAVELMGADELHEITAEPRRYGFHATLKAPFRLADGCSFDALVARIKALAVTLQPLALGPLQVATLGNFVALVPSAAPAELATLASACVTELDDLRAPLSAADLLRRQATHLDAREQELLQRYGYPYVLERYRLHFTLSGPVDAATAQRVRQAVAESVTQLNALAPLVLDRLCLFVEPAPGQAFRRLLDAEVLA
jgi:putative phosphonate metabolism protein